jgi:hypothetical protein
MGATWIDRVPSSAVTTFYQLDSCLNGNDKPSVAR